MKLRPSVASVISEHVVFELESIDRVYLNVYVPRLQREAGVAAFFRFHRGHLFASSALMDPISKDFVARLDRFAKQQRVPLVQFRKGERKDDVAAEYLKKFKGQEGVLFIGKAQEKTRVFRTERRRNSKTGATHPWLTRSTAMVNTFYIYGVDRDFGPFFLSCRYRHDTNYSESRIIPQSGLHVPVILVIIHQLIVASTGRSIGIIRLPAPAGNPPKASKEMDHEPFKRVVIVRTCPTVPTRRPRHGIRAKPLVIPTCDL